MLFRLPDPALGERKGHGKSHQQGDPRQGKNRVKQLPHEVSPSRRQPAAPAPADVTLSHDNTIEKDKAHYASYIQQDDSDGEPGDEDCRDQRGQHSVINS